MKQKIKYRHIFMILLLAAVMVLQSAYLDGSDAYALGKSKKMYAPKLTQLSFYQCQNGTYAARITWKSQKKATYQILRKGPDDTEWKVVGTKKARSKTTSFANYSLQKDGKYTYTVRQVKGSKKSTFDSAGLTTIGDPGLSVNFTNLKATLKWNKVSGASKYFIYRKIGKGDSFHKIATVSSSTTSYTDVYQKSHKNKKMKAILTSDYFVDPSNNPIIYNVRPYYSKKVGKTTKESYGLSLRDGEWHLEPPTLISVASDGTVTWGTVPLANGYKVLMEDGDGVFHIAARVPANKKGGKYQSVKIKKGSKNARYAVQSYCYKNCTTEYSDYDTGFTLKDNGIGKGRNVLFLGDSMTFGSPYYGVERNNFSYANRIKQLTGIKMFNPSIPGATWHYSARKNRYRIVNGVAAMIAAGQNTDYAFGRLKIGTNKQRFEDFDVVLLAAGTNDYQDIAKTYIGEKETDWAKVKKKTKNLTFTVNADSKKYKKTYKKQNFDYDISTFDGSYNQIMKYIEEASIIRILRGKSPINVVSIGLFYSDRTYPYYKITNRNTTKNWIGYKLGLYQDETNRMNAEWNKSPVLNIYNYDSQGANIVNQSNCPFMSSDNLHFTKYSYGLYGNDIAGFMKSNRVFDRLSAEEIDAIKHSKEFKDLLRKYMQNPEFWKHINKDSYTSKEAIYALLNEDEVVEEVPEEIPEEEILPEEGTEENGGEDNQGQNLPPEDATVPEEPSGPVDPENPASGDDTGTGSEGEQQPTEAGGAESTTP